eukprot:TRINITY_DN123_c0_g1_i2.p1 TRINITY_DN123_c0_g1~~TRINITY_DN123_c0_g1_i2.p1  ORF type:complete len:356 (-),score=70.48 TRINITY_DN123_c0_g1_i2:49-999(-)
MTEENYGSKVFVGNLSFRLKESDLASYFSAVGRVTDVNIISRGTSSLGYGFVEFESDEQAQKAVEEMDKMEIDGRAVNVELAKPMQQQQQKESPNRGYSNNRGGGRGGGRGGYGYDYGYARGRGRGSRGGPQRFYNNNNYFNRNAYYNDNNYDNYRGNYRDGGPRRGRGSRRRGGRNNYNGQALSQNSLFVANLPFNYGDNDLYSLFESYNPKSARVVMNLSGRSRGYGFVEFDNQEDQIKASEELDGLEIEGDRGYRSITVNVALERETQNTNNEDEGDGDGDGEGGDDGEGGNEGDGEGEGGDEQENEQGDQDE